MVIEEVLDGDVERLQADRGVRAEDRGQPPGGGRVNC
jgi:hypothetical protein